jgi:hypothetical protein
LFPLDSDQLNTHVLVRRDYGKIGREENQVIFKIVKDKQKVRINTRKYTEGKLSNEVQEKEKSDYLLQFADDETNSGILNNNYNNKVEFGNLFDENILLFN